jgi:hypothetical protein
MYDIVQEHAFSLFFVNLGINILHQGIGVAKDPKEKKIPPSVKYLLESMFA